MPEGNGKSQQQGALPSLGYKPLGARGLHGLVRKQVLIPMRPAQYTYSQLLSYLQRADLIQISNTSSKWWKEARVFLQFEGAEGRKGGEGRK